MSSQMFLNAAHFLVPFLVFEFSLEVFNSSTAHYAQQSESLCVLLFKTRNFPGLRLSQTGRSNFALNQGLSQPTVQPSFERPFSNLDGLLKKTAFGRFAIMATPFGRLGKSCRVPYNKILC